MSKIRNVIACCLIPVFILVTSFTVIDSAHNIQTILDVFLPAFLVLLISVFRMTNKKYPVQVIVWLILSFWLIFYHSSLTIVVLPETQVQSFRVWYRAGFWLLLAGLIYLATKKKVNLLVIYSICASSLPFYSHLMSGIGYRGLLIFLYLLIYIFWFKIEFTTESIPYWVLICIILVSGMASDDIYSSLSGTINFVTAILFLMVLNNTTFNRSQVFRTAFLVFGSGVVFYLLLIILYYWMPVGGDILSRMKGSAVFAGINVNSIGTHATLTFIASAFFVMRWQSNRFLFILFMISSGLVLYFSEQKSAYIACPASVMLLLIFTVVTKFKNTGLTLWVTLILSVTAILGAVFLYNVESIFSLSTIHFRLVLWPALLRSTIQANPLLGYGPEAWHLFYFANKTALEPEVILEYNRFLSSFGPDMHAHNLAVGWFFSFGIIGTIALIWTITSIASKIRINSLRSYQFLAISLLVSVVITGITEYTLADFHLLIIISICLASFHKTKEYKRITKVILPGFIPILILFGGYYYSVHSYNEMQESYKQYMQMSVFRSVKPIPEKLKEIQQSEPITDHPRELNISNYYEAMLAGEWNLAQGSVHLAESNFKRCLEDLPVLPHCHYRLSEIYMESGRLQLSEHHSIKAKEHDPFGYVNDFLYKGSGPD